MPQAKCARDAGALNKKNPGGIRTPPLRGLAHDALLLVGFIAAAGVGSLLLGQDANWDLQNYHYYDAWAWWQGRTFTRDVAAAQVQTFHNPILYLPFYGLVTAGVAPRVIAVALAIPAAVAAFILSKLSLLLIRDGPRGERLLAVACAVTIGVTSAMGLGALGNTMNEWTLAALLLGALWLIVRGLLRAGGSALSVRALLAAGALAGIASGAKLTAASLAVGLCLALLCRGPYTWQGARTRIAEAAWFAAGMAAGVVIALGPWAYQLWVHFESPIFPYGNQWIQSPWWEPKAVPQPHAYGPRTLGQWLAFPFVLASPPLFLVAEVPYRDGRIALMCALALAAAVAAFARRRQADGAHEDAGIRAAWRVIALFVVVSFVLWAAQHSIYRYLLTLDLLTGLLIVALLRALCGPRLFLGAAVLATAVLVSTTRFANWGRIDFGERWFEVKSLFPRVEDNAMVLITSGEAVSYLIPLLPDVSRYVAAMNTSVHPGQRTRLADTVREIVREHRGPLYQLTYPLTEGAHLLPAFGLARTNQCAVVVTNMPTSPLELCRLVRVP